MPKCLTMWLLVGTLSISLIFKETGNRSATWIADDGAQVMMTRDTRDQVSVPVWWCCVCPVTRHHEEGSTLSLITQGKGIWSSVLEILQNSAQVALPTAAFNLCSLTLTNRSLVSSVHPSSDILILRLTLRTTEPSMGVGGMDRVPLTYTVS